MPFGTTNAPATFMRMMNDILRLFTNNFLVVYLDDILIYSKTWGEHLQHIQQVLHTLRQHKLYANLKNAPSAWTWSITWATSLINMVYIWIQPRSKSSVTGQPQPLSLSFGASWALPISTAGSCWDSPILHGPSAK
jgi:hypothetical protein